MTGCRRIVAFKAGRLAAATAALSLAASFAMVFACAVPASAQNQSAAVTATGGNASASVDPSAQKGAAGRALDKVKEAAKSASDIFSRVPCSTPKSMKFEGSLPRIARKLAAGEPVTIVAFGSSSTAGYGASSAALS